MKIEIEFCKKRFSCCCGRGLVDMLFSVPKVCFIERSNHEIRSVVVKRSGHEF